MIPFTLLVCPHCKGTLENTPSQLSCTPCKRAFSLINETPCFVANEAERAVGCHKERKKSILRSILRKFRAPHHSIHLSDGSDSRFEGKELHRLLEETKEGSVFLNIGALSRKLPIPPQVTLYNVDISYYPHVDLVADGQELPIQSESVDGVLLKNVLEHVESPERILREVKRILKPGGILYIKNPFLQPFHAVPDDFTRWTQSGNPTLFSDMKTLDYGVSIGPSSALSWILREYCALFWSFGSRKAYLILLEVFGWLTFWIKYLDFFFRQNKESHRLASAFYGIYQKQ